MSAFGTKRTCHFALHMSAYDQADIGVQTASFKLCRGLSPFKKRKARHRKQRALALNPQKLI